MKRAGPGGMMPGYDTNRPRKGAAQLKREFHKVPEQPGASNRPRKGAAQLKHAETP